jgi:hypothetical protein
MVVTPNSAQTPSNFAGPLVQNPAVQNPAVLNLRRPGAAFAEPVAPSAAAPDANIVLATVVADDDALPTTVLRLPHLAATDAGSSRKRSIASIAHWVAIVLGAIIALWLIFAGRAKPLEDAPSSTAPARADAAPGADWKAPPLPSAGDSAAPSWNPPPLPSAGDSAAPKWTPPAAAPPATAPDSTSNASPAHEHNHDHAPAGEMPAHETWPKGESTEPAASQPEFPTAPETTAQYAPIGSNTGPAYRTAKRDTPPVEPYTPAADDDVQPLGITVPVPQ